MEKVYEWTRFWCPEGENYYIDREGYLIDPKYQFSPNSHLIVNPLERKEKCIILLGEPGAGKTIAMESYNSNLEKKFKNSSNKILPINLRIIGDQISFKSEIFENSIFKDWLNADYNLFLLLDSFDECYIRTSVIAHLLSEYLKRISQNRIFLRIACRTGYWPTGLKSELIKIFGKDNVLVFELVPLRKEDVEIAAKSSVKKSDMKSPMNFLKKIRTLEAVPFAVRPITLQALINHYNRYGALPNTKKDIYYSNCLRLCEEFDSLRRKEFLNCEFTPEQRFVVASKYAALCIFSKHKGIWTGFNMENIEVGYIPKSIIRLYQESIKDSEFVVTDKCIEETLACGLFTTSDPRREWAHWTFLEYLAAYYIIHTNLPLVQILSLIENPFDPERKVVPQLRGVVSWLCSINEDLFNVILYSEPELLLRSDITHYSKDLKEKIVFTLLENYDYSPIRVNILGFIQYFKKLCYFGLENQIMEFILQIDKSWESKRFAIMIAEECGFLSLASNFIELILDNNQNIQVRIAASRALESFSQSNEINNLNKLIPIALSDAPIDNDYFDLKGLCLIILWPKIIHPNDLFDHLPEPNLGYVGNYSRFLFERLVEGLSESGIEKALIWIKERLKDISRFSLFRRIIDLILSKTLNFIANKNIFETLSNTVCIILSDKNYLEDRYIEKSSFQSKLSKDQEIRRNLLRSVLKKISSSERILYQLLVNFYQINIQEFTEQPLNQSRLFELLVPDDLDWLINELENSNDDEYNQKIAFLINRMFPRDLNHYDRGYELDRKFPALHKYFIYWFGPIKIDSEEAYRMRRDYKTITEFERSSNHTIIEEFPQIPQTIKPSPTKKIESLLNQFESGNIDAWSYLNILMMFNENNVRKGNELNPDITSLQGWTYASENLHIRIIECAKKYLYHGEPNLGSWVGTSILYRPAYAGYRALRLIFEFDVDFFNNLPVDIWKKWTPIVLLFKIETYDNQKNQRERKIRSKILEKAYLYGKEELIETLSAEIDFENKHNRGLSIIHVIENIWDDDIAKLLYDKAIDENFKPEVRGDLFDTLCRHNFAQIEEFIKDLLSKPLPDKGVKRDLTIKAVKALMLHSSKGGWDLVFPIIQDNKDWGKGLIEFISEEDRFSRELLTKYSIDQLSDLYIWLADQYSYKTDPQLIEHPRIQTMDDSVRELRDQILKFIEARGSFESVGALRKIMAKLPQMKDILSFRLVRAQEIARKYTWDAPNPQDVLELFKNSSSRLIQSGEQLLDTLNESFERLEDKLQGRGYHPKARDLWDRQKDGKFRPIYENELSNYIKNYLIEYFSKNIVIQREVEVDEISKTDLLITLINLNAKPHQNPKVEVVIEVKGSWHQEIKESMQDQLLGRYMRPRAYNYGLYLVGWFRSPYWDPSDNRKGKNNRKFPTLNDLKIFLENQAVELSKEEFMIESKIIDASLTTIYKIRESNK